MWLLLVTTWQIAITSLCLTIPSYSHLRYSFAQWLKEDFHLDLSFGTYGNQPASHILNSSWFKSIEVQMLLLFFSQILLSGKRIHPCNKKFISSFFIQKRYKVFLRSVLFGSVLFIHFITRMEYLPKSKQTRAIFSFIAFLLHELWISINSCFWMTSANINRFIGNFLGKNYEKIKCAYRRIYRKLFLSSCETIHHRTYEWYVSEHVMTIHSPGTYCHTIVPYIDKICVQNIHPYSAIYGFFSSV